MMIHVLIVVGSVGGFIAFCIFYDIAIDGFKGKDEKR